jgi:DNA polymerase-1
MRFLENNHLKIYYMKLAKNNKNNFLTENEIIELDNQSSQAGCLKFNQCILITDFNKLLSIKLLPTIGLDIETTGFNPKIDKIIGIGISDKNRHIYIAIEENKDTSLLSKWLSSLFTKSHLICCHNGKFEYKFIKEFLGVDIPGNKLIDSMVLAYLLGYTPLNLASLANKLLNKYPMKWEQLAKDCHNHYHIPYDEIVPYCCEDALESLELSIIFLTEYHQNFNDEIILDIDMGNVSSIGLMELQGVKIDKNNMNELIEECEFLKEIYNDDFVNLVGSEFNINSPKSLSILLYEKLKLPTEGIKRGKSGYFSTDKESLNELEGLHPVLEVIRDMSVVSQLEGLIKGINELTTEDNYIFPNTNNCLTVTGRLSMSNPNLQQSPNPSKYKSLKNESLAELGYKFRKCFVVKDDNHKFVISDYPSFEFRILAHLSQDETLLKIFNDYLDFHVIICERLFNVTYDKNNKQHKLFRQVTKTINYGVAYGMSHHKLYRECLKVGLNYSIEKCLQILRDYWVVLPGVHAFFIREKLNSVIQGFNETFYGRKRYYNFNNFKLVNWIEDNVLVYGDIDLIDEKLLIELWNDLTKEKLITYNDEKNFRQVQNFPMQGTNADCVRLVINELTEELPPTAKLILTVHDEFIVESHLSSIEESSFILKEKMINSIKLSVPLPIDVVVVNNWGDGK